ncbi:pilus assembly PilX family protein [Rubritalea tangerina]|uniref:Uncharacterized protein n=1 Tax=Rubritalea tangerina TaxID=430798 RepID=A0ABW4ZAE2_9BACT
MRRYHKTERPQSCNTGLALIASLSVMALLVMVAVGMLSLSTMEQRRSGVARYQMEAQANARMALSVALGELQKSVGQDQRVTARGEIVDGVNDEKRYLTGVWSTENWDPKDPNKREFIGWMASVPMLDEEAPSEEDVRTGLGAYGVEGSSLVTVVGDGSVLEKEDYVKVATVPVRAANGALSGAYGWWVDDVASKASYAVAQRDEAEAWERAASLGVAVKSGLKVMDQVAFESYPAEQSENVASQKSIDLIHAVGRQEVSRQYFHDMGHQSLSLMTNTRDGGMKSDLSTAFELEDFAALEEFHHSKERNDTSNYRNLWAGYSDEAFYPSEHPLGYVFEVPVGSDRSVRGPTWDLLRNYYRIYKKEWEEVSWPRQLSGVAEDSIVARGALPLSYASSYQNEGDVNGAQYGVRTSPGAIYGRNVKNKSYGGELLFKDYAERVVEGVIDPTVGTRRATAQRVMPQVIRVTMVFGIRKKLVEGTDPVKYRLAFSIDPYVTLHNPYNREIEFESLSMFTNKFNPLGIALTYYDENGELQDTMSESRPRGFTQNSNNRGALSYRLLPESGGNYRMAAGEIRVISPKGTGDGSNEFYFNQNNVVLGDFEYGEDSGIYVYPNPPLGGDSPIIPDWTRRISVKLFGRTNNNVGKNVGDFYMFHLLSNKDHDGGARDINELNIPGSPEINRDYMDDAFMSTVLYSTYQNVSKTDAEDHDLYVEQEFNGTDVPDVNGEGRAIAALDVRMAHAGEGVPVYHQFSPRSQLHDLRNYDGSTRSEPSWKVDLLGINDTSELELVSANERGFWGAGKDASSGSEFVVLNELPRAPLTSLAQLSHADTTVLPADGAAPIGNAFTHPGIKDTRLISGKRSLVRDYKAPDSQVMTDFSWASNEALWDQYFFSSINWGEAKLAYESGAVQPYGSQEEALRAMVDGADIPALVNPRMVYLPSGMLEVEVIEEAKDHAKIARHLAVEGGFNVNSTSVEAWKAVLGSLKEHAHSGVDGGNLRELESNNAMTRFQLPAGGDIATANSEKERWTAFRDLSDDEISDLAEAMVDQIKARGPFMGMADFVNRRLSNETKDGNDVGKLGAIQMAIEAANLNEDFGDDVSVDFVENKEIQVAGSTRRLSAGVGASAYLMQSDVLASLGSIMRTRSDTFVVRAYGEAFDSRGKVMAKAWCEATVQRVPAWCEASEEKFKVIDPDYPNLSSDTIVQKWVDNPNVTATNRKYGRKLKVVSFRWLAADEV